jgi:hypothetical protein
MKEPSNEFDHTSNQIREERTEPMSLLDLEPERSEQKNKQDEERRMNLDEKNLSSLESLHESISSSTQTVNSALAAFSLLIDNGEGFAQRMSGSDKKKQFREYFLKMRQEYEKVAIITESIGEFSRLIADQSGRIVVAKQIEKNAITSIDIPRSTKISPC